MLVMDIGTFINNTSKLLNIGGFKGMPLLADPSLHNYKILFYLCKYI